MPDHFGVQPPSLWGGLIWCASWLAPGRLRPEWRRRQEGELMAWWILVERGELTVRDYQQMALRCWGAFADAFWTRFSRDRLRRIMRGPASVMACLATVVLITGMASRGFRGTRAVIEAIRVVSSHLPGSAQMAAPSAAEDSVVGHAFVLIFALLTSVVLVALRRVPIHLFGWRYWTFLGFKTVAIVALVPVLWIETTVAVRNLLPPSEFRVLLIGLLFTLVFILAFVCALAWSFADQRRRCPVCLGLLAMPVSMGSWASVFEPASTELLCGEGHGTLLVSETGTGEPERWTALDASWRELFETKSR